jgi:hypothetical protein
MLDNPVVINILCLATGVAFGIIIGIFSAINDTRKAVESVTRSQMEVFLNRLHQIYFRVPRPSENSSPTFQEATAQCLDEFFDINDDFFYSPTDGEIAIKAGGIRTNRDGKTKKRWRS